MDKTNFFAKDGTAPRKLKQVTVATSTSSQSKPSSGRHNPLLSEECLQLLNYRIQQEDYSSRMYLSMSLWLNNKGYVHSAALWKTYSEEERTHADWSRTYLLSMGVQPDTPELEAPGNDYAGLPDIIRKSFAHEIEITEQIKDLATTAMMSGDHMLYTLTAHYLKEQVEEHDKTQNLVDQLEAFGEDKIALRLLDNSFAQ